MNAWICITPPTSDDLTSFLFVFDLGDDDEWEDTDEEDEEQDYDSEGGLSEDEEGGRREFMFADCETKSRFTE